jgi:hypothetical protein
MLMNMSGEAPMPWAYAGVTNIEKLLDMKYRLGGPAKFGRNIVGNVANATARPAKSVAFPAVCGVLERRSGSGCEATEKMMLQQKLGAGSCSDVMGAAPHPEIPQQKDPK